MKARSQLVIMVALLFFIGTGLTLYKCYALGFMFTPGTETVWQIQGRIQFDADGGPTKVSLILPTEDKSCKSVFSEKLSELQVPFWETLLNLASRCYEVTGLGYLGADIVLDKNRGPLVLELNARPGLAIQIANGMGLQTRLETIESQKGVERTAEERVAYVIEAFG